MVSVIIPNFNHAPFLKQRINSVLNQTYNDFDITILDDCSTDNSRDVIETYRNHPKVSAIVYNEKNSGSTFKQWQKGIELVKGEWVWIAESDDWCEANFLETLMNGVNASSVIAIAQSIVVSIDGRILWKSHTEYLEERKTGKAFAKSKMLLDNFGIPNTSMCIFKRSCYFNIDTTYTTYKFCGDMLFWISLAMFGDVFISGKYLNYFRKHDKDVSGAAYKTGLHYFEYFRLLDNLLKRQIITREEKQELLRGKLQMFLRDDRLDIKIEQEVKDRFRSLLDKKFHTIIFRFKAIQFFKSLKRFI